MARKRARRAVHRSRKVRKAARKGARPKTQHHTKPVKRRQPKPRSRRADAGLEPAVRAMNRGRSLTAAAKEFHVSRRRLQEFLLHQRLAKRKGKRWATKDNRPRRVPVMTGGRFRVLIVRNYKEARLVGEHHQAVGEFVRTNDIRLIKPFKGRTVQTISGRRYPLETSPNGLHRIAAMDTPPFHEIYDITSST